MKAIKIIVLTLVLSAISSNVYCVLFTVTNKGPEPITVNIDIEKPGLFPTSAGTLTAEVKPGKTSNKGLDAHGGKAAKAIYLTKAGKELPLSNSNTVTGNTRFKFGVDGLSTDTTFIFTKNNKGVWGFSRSPSKK